MKRRWLLIAACFGVFWEFAAWVTKTDFTSYVHTRERVSEAYDAAGLWSGGGCDL